MEKPVLHIDKFWISPYSFSSFVALTEKDVEFEINEISLDQKQHQTPAYQEISYTGRVPSLSMGSFHLAESSAIAEFLEEAFPKSGVALFPSDTKKRATARMIMAWLRSDFAALRNERATHTMFFSKASRPLSEDAKADVDKLIGFCTKIGSERMFLFDQWSLVDAELSFMIHRLILNGHEVPANVLEYAVSNWQRSSVRKFVERARPAYLPY